MLGHSSRLLSGEPEEFVRPDRHCFVSPVSHVGQPRDPLRVTPPGGQVRKCGMKIECARSLPEGVQDIRQHPLRKPKQVTVHTHSSHSENNTCATHTKPRHAHARQHCECDVVQHIRRPLWRRGPTGEAFSPSNCSKTARRAGTSQRSARGCARGFPVQCSVPIALCSLMFLHCFLKSVARLSLARHTPKSHPRVVVPAACARRSERTRQHTRDFDCQCICSRQRLSRFFCSW